jgi:glycosyltransferase involved in cell wall biosynthesis
MPSRSEGFGLALIEAVQQKVPVICSDISVFKELFTNDEVTFFRSGSLPSLTNALEDEVESGKLKCESAYNRYNDNYRSAIMAKKYSDLYQSVYQ